jgi:hypothetical protein
MGLESLLLPAATVFVLVLLVRWISSSRDWEYYEGEYQAASTAGWILKAIWTSPAAWMLTFFVVAAGVGITAVLAVSEEAFVAVGTETVVSGLLGAMAGLVGVFLFLGTYYSIRSRGAQSSVAAALSSMLIGFVLLALISLRLAGIV